MYRVTIESTEDSLERKRCNIVINEPLHKKTSPLHTSMMLRNFMPTVVWHITQPMKYSFNVTCNTIYAPD